MEGARGGTAIGPWPFVLFGVAAPFSGERNSPDSLDDCGRLCARPWPAKGWGSGFIWALLYGGARSVVSEVGLQVWDRGSSPCGVERVV